MSEPWSVSYADNALFRNVPRELLEGADVVVEEIRLAPGERVFEEGDAPDYCYLVGSGAVRITKLLPPGGREELLSVIEAGDFFGELALYDAAVRSARATAAVPTRLGRIDGRAFEHLRQTAPLQLATTLADRTIERVRKTNALLVSQLAKAGRLSEVGHDLGTLSHNLRSPLATIRNAAELSEHWLCTEGHDPEKVLQFLEIIRHTANRGLAQIDELMLRLRGDTGPRRARTPVGEILREVGEQVQGLLAGRNVRYHDAGGESCGDVLVDHGDMVAALANLVKNAIESLPDGCGEVEVSAAEEGDWCVFRVRDDGCGIPEDHLPVLFESGFTSGKEGGTGLGLAHVRAVVQRHGGSIDVESSPGRGTVFLLRLPRYVE